MLVDLHDDPKSKLAPDRYYLYHFRYKGVTSRTGRFRTLPAADDGKLDQLRLAVLTCNDYSSGYFNAFHHLAEENVDFVIHLGDFAYEYAQYPPGFGKIYREDLKLAKGNKTANSLQDFRTIYQTYRRDPGLQAAMENHTWIIMLDDHEIADNAYWDYAKDTLGAHPDNPIYKRKNAKHGIRRCIRCCRCHIGRCRYCGKHAFR